MRQRVHAAWWVINATQEQLRQIARCTGIKVLVDPFGPALRIVAMGTYARLQQFALKLEENHLVAVEGH